ncbi:MAG: hypothetical protein AAF410_02945 [Pseudomonadota bacterium]
MNDRLKYILITGLVLPVEVVAGNTELDCNQSDINYVEQPGMTRAERLEAMNRAFFESVNRFDECNLSVNSSASSSAANPSSSFDAQENSDNVSGSEGSESEALNNQGQASVASSGLSGTEVEVIDDSIVKDTLESTTDDLEATENIQVANTGPIGQGKTPEDIPEANNDDVVAAQIRLAAEIETDPEKKEKLWNEYRKYKGLPQQP